MPAGAAEGRSPYCGRSNHEKSQKKFDHRSIASRDETIRSTIAKELNNNYLYLQVYMLRNDAILCGYFTDIYSINDIKSNEGMKNVKSFGKRNNTDMSLKATSVTFNNEVRNKFYYEKIRKLYYCQALEYI